MNDTEFKQRQLRALTRIADALEKMSETNATLCALFERDANEPLGDEVTGVDVSQDGKWVPVSGPHEVDGPVSEMRDLSRVRIGDTRGKDIDEVRGDPPGTHAQRMAEQFDRVQAKRHPYSPTCTCTACKTIRNRGYAAADDDAVLGSFGTGDLHE